MYAVFARQAVRSERSEHHLNRCTLAARKDKNAMAFVPVPDTLMAELRFISQGQQCENTLYFTGSAGVSPSLAADLGDALISWWQTQFQTGTSDQTALVEVFLTDLTSDTSFTLSDTNTLPLVGGSSTDALPQNCAHCVSFRTAQRGRSGRGRNYVLGLTEADSQDSILLSTVVAAHVTAYSVLIGPGAFVPGLQWVVVSRFHNGAPRVTGLAIPITNVLSVDAVIDSQRRRLPGRGR